MPHEDRAAPEDDSRTNKMPHFFVFLSPVTLSFDLLTFDSQIRTRARFLCNTHTAKFHHPPFNRSGVNRVDKQQTDKIKHTDAAENIHLAPLCYVGGKYLMCLKAAFTSVARVMKAQRPRMSVSQIKANLSSRVIVGLRTTLGGRVR